MTDDSTDHYGAPDLETRVRQAMREAGWLDRPVTPEELAPFDQFHTGGAASTAAMAALLPLGPGTTVLDAGGGLGGPARFLAAAHGCSVTVVDLTEAYCRLGTWLTGLTGLDGRVRFRHASVLEVPEPDGAFDLVWTQHCAMNVADKPALYRELVRVLRPGGTLAIHDIMAGPVQPVHFPVPWSLTPAGSHLAEPAALRALLARMGLAEVRWEDLSAEAIAWFRDRPAAVAASPLTLALLLGEHFQASFANMMRNFEEDRVRVIRSVWRKPAT